MTVRQRIRLRLRELDGIAQRAKEKEDQATMVDVIIRKNELELLLKDLRK